jgi:ABC-2 type transport system permease protein
MRGDSIAKAAVVVFGLGNVLGIGFWVAYESFKYIESFWAFGATLNAKLVSLLFFALLILIILSTVIVAYTTIFVSKETEFLFQYPVSPRTVFLLKTAEAISFSSWASLFLCLPVLIAYGLLKKAPITYYPQVAAILVMFLLFSGFMGAVVSLAVAPLVRRLRPRQLLVVGGVVLVVLAWVFLRSFRIWEMDGENNLLILDRFTTQLAAIHSPYFPGSWASSAVLSAANGQHRDVLFHGATLLANTLIFLPILSLYGTRLYGSQWILCHNAIGGALAPSRRSRKADAQDADAPTVARPSSASGRLRVWPPLLSLMFKDIKVFVRDPAQISQSILFVLLMVIYSLSLVRIPRFMTQGNLQLLVYFANLGAVCAILSSFTSRFLFPLISLEGKAFWIVGLAPMPRSYILHAKALFGLVVSLLLGLVTTVVSNTALDVPLHLFAAAVYIVLLAGICLTALATGLGAAYPVYDEDNPARIAVGIGGTLNFFASALSVAVLVALEAAPFLFVGRNPGAWQLLAHAAALLFTLLLLAVCFRVGNRALQGRDF